MSMVEPGNCWDSVPNGDEEFENILSILDFPVETLEGDGLEDWDISKSQCFGPIPSNVFVDPLTGTLMGPNNKTGSGPAYSSSEPIAPIAGAPDQKQLSNPIFHTQSPVSVLEGSNGSCSGGKSLPLKSQNQIPVRTRTKRVRPAGVNPWLLISPLCTPSKKGSSYPSKKDKEKRRNRNTNNKASQLPFSIEPTKDSPQALPHHRSPVVKKCTHCEITKTPQWREGPLGPKTLCNACGVRYRSGRLFPEYRPAASPTFVPSLHSNSHKKVIEMRSKTKEVNASKIEDNPTSPQPEFIPMNSHWFDYIY